jgi:hypothetical protein
MDEEKEVAELVRAELEKERAALLEQLARVDNKLLSLSKLVTRLEVAEATVEMTKP